MRIECGKQYRIKATDKLFADWFDIVAVCKREVNGFFEMHANDAFIYCTASQLGCVRKPKVQK